MEKQTTRVFSSVIPLFLQVHTCPWKEPCLGTGWGSMAASCVCNQQSHTNKSKQLMQLTNNPEDCYGSSKTNPGSSLIFLLILGVLMQTHHLLGVSSLKIRCNSKNGDDKGTFPTIHKSFKWGSGVNTIFSVLTSMKKFISQTFKYTYERHHIITNKDACFSESCGKACRRNLCDKRHRSPGTGIFPASWCGGMTVNLWGTAGASLGHIQGGLSRRTQLVLQETQNLHGCVLHLTAGGLGRCGTLWLHQELEDAMGQWGRRDSKGVLVLRAELDMFSTRDDSAGRPWDDALVLHSVSFTLCCWVKPFSCSSFDSPWQWDLEKGTENVQKVSFLLHNLMSA